MSNLPIAVNVNYTEGILSGGALIYSFSIDLGQLENGQLQSPINMKVLATLNNGQRFYLVYGTDYLAQPNLGYPSGGITVTLLRLIPNCSTLYFVRYTAANYNVDFTTFLNQPFNYASEQNTVYQNIYAILQEEQLSTSSLQEAILNLVPWSAVGAPLGVAPLNANGIVPNENLPFDIVAFAGQWNATLNLPFLTAGVGSIGDIYFISVSGTQTAPSGLPVFYNQNNWLAYTKNNIWEQISLPLVFAITQTVTPGDVNNAPSNNAVVNFVSPIVNSINNSIANKADKLNLTAFNTPNLGDLTFNLLINADGQITSIQSIPISISSSNIIDFANAINALLVNKTNKIIPTVPGNFAALTSTGDLQDGGARLSREPTFASPDNISVPSTLAVASFVNSGLSEKVNLTLLGQANGVATLDSGGQIPLSQLPFSGLTYKGGWNALTNTPLLTAGIGTNGDAYITTVSGTQTAPSGVARFYEVGSTVIYDGSVWVYNPFVGGVISVNNLTGAVELNTDSVPEGLTNLYWSNTLFNDAFIAKTTTDLIEGTNLYYTDLRVQSYIETPQAAATTLQQGTVQLMPDATTNLVPDQTIIANIASGAMLQQGLIADNENLDNLITTGIYYQATDAGAASGQNYPQNNLGGHLIVINSSALSNEPSIYSQLYLERQNGVSQGKMALRNYYNGNWDNWDYLAPLNSPEFTGIPTAPTPLLTDNSTKIATTEFVQNVASMAMSKSLDVITSKAKLYAFNASNVVVLTFPGQIYTVSFQKNVSNATAAITQSGANINLQPGIYRISGTLGYQLSAVGAQTAQIGVSIVKNGTVNAALYGRNAAAFATYTINAAANFLAPINFDYLVESTSVADIFTVVVNYYVLASGGTLSQLATSSFLLIEEF